MGSVRGMRITRRTRLGVWTATCLVLVAGLLTAVPAAPAASDEASPKPRNVPVRESEEPRDPELALPDRDFSRVFEAGSKPKPTTKGSFDEKKSKLTRREAKADIYLNEDGSNTAVLYAGDANWKDAAGKWHRIDPSLVEDGTGGLRSKSAPVTVRMPSTTDDGLVTTVSGDGWSIAYSLEGARRGARAKVDGARATYKNVLLGVDIEQQALAQGVKELIILHAAPKSGADGVFRYPLQLNGVTPVPADDGSVLFNDAAGTAVAEAPATVAWDATKAPARGESTRYPLGLAREGNGWVLEVRVPGSYLSDPARTYPVTIDPTINAGLDTTQYDAFAASTNPNQNYNGAAQFYNGIYQTAVGFDVYPTSQYYGYQYFDLTPVMGKNILDATWYSHAFEVAGSGFFRLWPVSQSWSASTLTWNNLPQHRNDAWIDRTAGGGSWDTADVTSWVGKWAASTWPSHGIAIDTAGLDSFIRFAASEETVNYRPRIFITYNRPPVPGQPSAPADGATVLTEQPTFSGTAGSDPDGGTVTYAFMVSTHPDGVSGSISHSGFSISRNWTPDLGTLVDGATYYWRMGTDDGLETTWSSPPRRLTVNLRLGEQPASPSDTAGPVTVNLATGNAYIRASSPAYDTVGGTVSVDYFYNSQAPSDRGLIGTYRDLNDASRQLVRRDPTINFSWDLSSPWGEPSGDDFTGEWTGFLTVPTSGQWSFFARKDTDATATIRVNSQIVLNGSVASEITLTAGQPVPIKVDYRHDHSEAYIEVWAIAPENQSVWRDPKNLRTTPLFPGWLSTRRMVLPPGWSMSVDGLEGLSYSSAHIGERSLVLKEPTGVVHEYVRQSDQSWKPTRDGDDVVTTVVEGGSTTYVVTAADGIVYTFDGGGNLIRAVTATDDGTTSVASLVYEYDTTSGRLASVRDPVSNRSITFTYAATGTVCPKNPTDNLTEDPPDGMLCKVRYLDGRETALYYKAGRLVRIHDPGDEITEFVYDSQSRVKEVLDPLAYDLIKASLRASDATTRAVIAYDTEGKVGSVTLPAPLAGAPRPAHSYVYDLASWTEVNVTGMPAPTRRVTYNSAGLAVEDQDADGFRTAWTYDAGERPVRQTGPTSSLSDSNALVTSNVYDHAGRAVETWGPARAACFGVAPNDPQYTGERPNGTCTVPVARTAYDQKPDGTPLRGLAAAYWDTRDQAGATASHETVGDATGRLFLDWGSGAPARVTSSPAGDNWSARFTGEVFFPYTGTYTFKACSDDGVRVFVDDVLVLNSWTATASCRTATTNVSATQNTRRRIRVDYFEAGGTASLELRWVRPVPTGGTLEETVPGTSLAPRYGLPTTSTDPDGKSARTEYALPEYGLATATVADPAALGLRTATTYEAPGTGFFRRTTRTLPRGAATTASYAYYTSGDTPPVNECLGLTAVGLLKSTTGADPAGAQGRRVEQFVYDSANRVMGTRVVGDARWTCTSYDARGRVTSTVDRAGKTTTVDYSTPGDIRTTFVDSAGATRTTTAKVDLLGRMWSYTDELGTTTRRTFDQAGRPKEVYRSLLGQPEELLESFDYGSNARMFSSTEHVAGTPRTSFYGYDAAGRPTTVTRPNNVVTTTGYDANSGHPTSVDHTKGVTRLSNWSYTRSPAGRVTAETLVSDVVPGRTRSYPQTEAYDGAGRLVKAVEGSVTRHYAYDTNSNRCAAAAVAVSCSSPTYTYDDADRIQSSPDYSAFVYDDHGNITSATPRVQPGPVSTNDSFSFDTASPVTPRSYPIVVGQDGTLNASVDWTNTGTVVTTASNTGSMPTSPSPVTHPAMTGPRPTDTELKASLSWSKFSYTGTDNTALTVAGGSSAVDEITTTATGNVTASMTWLPTRKDVSATGTVSNVSSVVNREGTFTPSGNGKISLDLTWERIGGVVNPDLDLALLDNATGQVLQLSNGTNAADQFGPHETISWDITDLGVYPPSSRTYRWRVSAKPGSSANFTLTGSYFVTATMDLKLENTSGTVLASSTLVSGTRQRNLTYANAAAGTYRLRASSADHAATPLVTSTYVREDHADLTLALKKGTTTLATARSNTGTATVAYVVSAGSSSGTFDWVITDNTPAIGVPSYTLAKTTTALGADTVSGTIAAGGTATRTVTADAAGFADVNLSWNQVVGGGYADLTVALKQGTTTLASARSATGTAALSSSVPAAGNYTVTIINNSVTLNVPSYSQTTRLPQRPPVAIDVVLKRGETVVANATGTKPRTLATAVTPGRYTLVVTPTAGKANATLAMTHPDYPNKYAINYDAHDHAIRIDDGKTIVNETLAPSGRVLRRVVTDAATGEVTEDTSFGYSDPGDSPAYASTGTTVTTYLGGVIYTGTTAAWQLANLHGDVVGTVDLAGTFTATPSADEFGVGQAPASRLGWLGGHDRFATGGRLSIIRMGVRLYDAGLGRFLQVDPVEGGCLNDYAYVRDPVNEFDLDGRLCPRPLMTLAEVVGFGEYVPILRAIVKRQYTRAAKMILAMGLETAAVLLHKGAAHLTMRTARRSLRRLMRSYGRLLRTGGGLPATVIASGVQLACVAYARLTQRTPDNNIWGRWDQYHQTKMYWLSHTTPSGTNSRFT